MECRAMMRNAGALLSSVALAAAMVPGVAIAADGSQLVASDAEEGAAALAAQAEASDGAAAEAADETVFDDATTLTTQAESAEEANSAPAASIDTQALSGEQTIQWANTTDESSEWFGSDEYVTVNGTANLISVKLPSGTTKTAAELSSAATTEEAYYSKGVLKAPAGSVVTMELLPSRGYQLTTNTVCGGNVALTPVDDDDKVGYYTFDMPQTSEGYALGCVFSAQADIVATDSKAVVSGSIADATSVVSSGSLRLDISDIDDTDIQADFNAKASSSANVVAYIDTWLYQITTQASSATDDENVWEDPLDEVSTPITVTLTLSDTAVSGASQFYIIREYEDNYQQASVTYDSTSKSITFKTDKFSSYAIVKGAPPSSTSSTTSTTPTTSSTTTSSSSTTTPKTGDTNDAAPFAVTAALAGVTALYSGRRLRRDE